MHDYMGNLKGILFYASQTADRTDGRLIASTLQTLSLSASVIHQAVLPDNARTGWPDKHLAPAQQLRDVQVFLVREQIATVKR